MLTTHIVATGTYSQYALNKTLTFVSLRFLTLPFEYEALKNLYTSRFVRVILAQAGNRASKTSRRLQWRDSRPEWKANVLCAAEHMQLDFFFKLNDKAVSRFTHQQHKWIESLQYFDALKIFYGRRNLKGGVLRAVFPAGNRIQKYMLPRTVKADSTLKCSQAVPHPSTNRALCCLISEVKRDPVHSTRYGRQRIKIVWNAYAYIAGWVRNVQPQNALSKTLHKTNCEVTASKKKKSHIDAFRSR